MFLYILKGFYDISKREREYMYLYTYRFVIKTRVDNKWKIKSHK